MKELKKITKTIRSMLKRKDELERKRKKIEFVDNSSQYRGI